MRNVIYSINLTIDGCCDHTKVSGSEPILEYFAQLIREADLMVYGRITYQLMVPYWPDVAKSPDVSKADKDFALAFDSIDKVVFSKTIQSVGEGTKIVRTDLKDEMLKLKQEPGGNILLGGVALSSQLIELGLVDEYRFVVHPIIAGGGRRLFEGINLPERLQLKLVDTKTLKSGQVALRYVKP
jgi:dihydrofolate reductase